MDINEAISGRRSTRAYTPAAIAEQTLRRPSFALSRQR